MGQQISQLREFIHSPSTLRAGYVLGWGCLFGFNIWQSFVGGIISYKTLPRQTFGLLQSRLFPAYFSLSTLLAASLITLEIKLRPVLYQSLKHAPLTTFRTLYNGGKFGPRAVLTSTTGLLFVSGISHLINGGWVGPEASKVMFKRHRLENLEGRKFEKEPSNEMQLFNKQFSRLHSISSSLNLISLISAGIVGWKIGVYGVGPFALGYGKA